jgi:hypothetical protein
MKNIIVYFGPAHANRPIAAHVPAAPLPPFLTYPLPVTSVTTRPTSSRPGWCRSPRTPRHPSSLLRPGPNPTLLLFIVWVPDPIHFPPLFLLRQDSHQTPHRFSLSSKSNMRSTPHPPRPCVRVDTEAGVSHRQRRNLEPPPLQTSPL